MKRSIAVNSASTLIIVASPPLRYKTLVILLPRSRDSLINEALIRRARLFIQTIVASGSASSGFCANEPAGGISLQPASRSRSRDSGWDYSRPRNEKSREVDSAMLSAASSRAKKSIDRMIVCNAVCAMETFHN